MEVFNSNAGMNEVILSNTIGQVIVRILIPMNWCGALLNRRSIVRIESQKVN